LLIGVALGKDDVEKEVTDHHPKNQMDGGAIDVLDNVVTGGCLTGWDEVLS
jgi:hypothetical protein